MRGRDAGIRTCITKGLVTVDALREQLTDPLSFGADVSRWLQHRGYPLTPLAKEIIAVMAHCNPTCKTLTALVRSMPGRHTEGSWRSEFQRSRLPPVAGFFHILRVIRSAAAIQAQRQLALWPTVQQYDYFDTAHLRRRCNEVIGSSPHYVHSHLAWEWMLFVALRRIGHLPGGTTI
jgi:hypothetical protein